MIRMDAAPQRWYTAFEIVAVNKDVGREVGGRRLVDGWRTPAWSWGRLTAGGLGPIRGAAAAVAATGMDLRCLVLDVTRGCTCLQLLQADVAPSTSPSRKRSTWRAGWRCLDAANGRPNGVEVGILAAAGRRAGNAAGGGGPLSTGLASKSPRSPRPLPSPFKQKGCFSAGQR